MGRGQYSEISLDSRAYKKVKITDLEFQGSSLSPSNVTAPDIRK